MRDSRNKIHQSCLVHTPIAHIFQEETSDSLGIGSRLDFTCVVGAIKAAVVREVTDLVPARRDAKPPVLLLQLSFVSI